MDWRAAVPTDGLFAHYYPQAINKVAPHPAAARLWQEFLFSDEGQNLWLNAYARPFGRHGHDLRRARSTAEYAKQRCRRWPARPQFPTPEQVDAAQQAVATELGARDAPRPPA